METLRLSYSSLGTFSSCPRKMEFDKLYPRRVRDDEDNYAADVGKAIHAGYQDYLVSGDKESAIWAFMQAFPFVEEMRQNNDYRSFEASLATLEEMFIEVKMNEYELAMIRRPLTPGELAGRALQAGLTGTVLNLEGPVVPAIEVPFEIRFQGISIPPCRRFPDGASLSVIGYIDAIMRHHMTRLYRTLDIKSSRMNIKDATGKYKFDSQQVPYGIVVEHISQESVESFEVLYLDCYIDLIEPRVSLYPFLKRARDLEEWCTNKLLQFQQIAKFCAADYFPRTDTGCLFYNRPCRYLEPCQSRDYDALETWFLLGEEPALQEAFQPWIVADVNVEG